MPSSGIGTTFGSVLYHDRQYPALPERAEELRRPGEPGLLI
jgi:hypothetical protein